MAPQKKENNSEPAIASRQEWEIICVGSTFFPCFYLFTNDENKPKIILGEEVTWNMNP